MDWHLYLWGTDYYPLETIITLLDYLGKDPQYRNRSLLLKAVADPPSEPEPGKIFSREQVRRLEYLHSCDVSPGGRQVLYSDNKTGGTRRSETPSSFSISEICLGSTAASDGTGGIVFTWSMGEEKYRIIWCAALKMGIWKYFF